MDRGINPELVDWELTMQATMMDAIRLGGGGVGWGGGGVGWGGVGGGGGGGGGGE